MAEISELKTHECWVYDYGCRADMVNKSEADKVISELKDKARHYPMMVLIIEEAKRDLLRQAKEIRHHKYKRCLDKAELCQWKAGIFIYKKEKNEFYYRWHKRWQKLSEKFNEAK